MARLLHALLLLLFPFSFFLFPSPLHAALDPQAEHPYELEIVLRIAESRSLTELFRTQLERELLDILRGAYGPVADVKIVHDHERLAEIDRKGLQRALDEWTALTGKKTQFVFVEFVDGSYDVVARQHDGLTGLSSPVIRHEQTRDQPALAKLIARTIVKDFGLVATVVRKPDLDSAQVVFYGSKLGTPESGWPRKGDLFYLIKVTQVGGGLVGSQVPWAVLRLDEDVKDGTAFGTVYHRHYQPLGDPTAIGYRCLHLATISAPLHLRMVKIDDRREIPQRGLRVHVNRKSFDPREADQVKGATNEDGYFATEDRTPEPFSGLALVRVVGANGRDRANIPVAMVDNRVVNCPLALGPDVLQDPGALQLEIWVTNLYRSVQGQSELFRELRELLNNPDSVEKSLALAETGAQRTERDLQQLKNTEHTLKREFGGKLDLSVGVQYLDTLEQGQTRLKTFIAQQKDTLNRQKDQGAAWKEIQNKRQKAQIAEAAADYETAIALYQQVVDAGATTFPELRQHPDWPKLTQHLDALKATWKLKDAEHAAARDFVYKDWPNFDLNQMSARTAAAAKALEKCKSVGDTLTPQKLLNVALAHAKRLSEEAAKLHPEDSREDGDRASKVAALSGQLSILLKETAAYLKASVK